MRISKILLAISLISGSHISWAAENSLDIWAWNINGPILEQAAEEYKKQHPEFKITVSDITSGDVYTKVSVGLQAKGKGLPDVILLEDTHLRGFLENWPSGFTNLSKLGYDAYKTNFPEFKVAINQLNGDFYGMPFDAGPVGIFYRPSIFKQAGIDPLSIKTWDDYISAGKIIYEKTGAYMTEIDPNDDSLARIIVGTYDTHYFDHQGHIDLNNPQVIEAFSVIKAMNDAGILYKGANNWDGFVQALASGKIVAVPRGAWLAGTIEMQAPDLAGDWAVMPLPKNAKGKNASNIGGSNFVIPASSDNIALAYDFMRFVTTDLQRQEAAFLGGLFPTYLPIYETESFQAQVPYFNNQAIWSEFARIITQIPKVNFTMDYSIIRDEVIKALNDITLKDKDVEKTLKNAAKRAANQTGRNINKY